MKINETEKLNLAILHGSQAYTEWSHKHDLSDYLSVILYELLLRKQLTQKELVALTGQPKQSINKGIHHLKEAGYIKMTVDGKDKRTKFCQLTTTGEKYAQDKMASLFEIEEKTARKLGPEKMKLLTELNEEWGNIFWRYLLEEGSD